MRKKIKASIINQEGEPLKSWIKQDRDIKIHFQTAKDFILYELSSVMIKIKKEDTYLEGKEEILKNIEEMRDYISTRVRKLDIIPIDEGEIPYRYNIDYTAQEGETLKEVENKLKRYLSGDVFLRILGSVDPQILEIIKQKEELKKREEEIKKREEAVEKKEAVKGKYKRSGHLTDQILKYSYPKDKSSQLKIFESLKSETLKDIEIAGVEVSEIVEGIKLSPSETKVIDCLCKLLHETSQKTDPTKQDYYSGNIGYDLIDYGGIKDTPAPKLAFTLYELTREYKGGEAISGKDVENVKQILTELDNKRFLLSYVETTTKKDGGRIERKIENFRRLLSILKISQTEYSKQDIELSKQEETVIVLNPIFRRQIDSKFILYPNDINRRTIIAYGSHNLSEISLKLRDYLIRELSSKRYTPEIGMDRLYYLLSEKWMKESRKKKVKEYTDKALETVKALGLLLSYEIKADTKGEAKIVFKLNKDWE